MGIDASKSAIRLRSYLRAKREQFRRMICEGLERRDLMAVFAPGTDESYRAAWEDYFHGRSGGSLGSGGAQGFNLLGSRWTNPTGGPSPNMGDPARISWSIVPDGTRVGPDSSSLQSSNLIAFMDGLYGTAPGPVGNRPWFKLIKQAYDNWSGLTGVQFVYEPNDDGADYSNTARGVTGVRGDVRVGGNRIDGNFGVLAYNFTPNSGGNSGWDGDMVIDTNDIFYANNSNGPNGENRGLINVLMHESGHGLGLGHVLPINGTKLMEPNLSLAFLGAQHDDILGSQTLYGDDFETNDTVTSPTDLGTRGNGTIQLNNVSIDRNADADIYRFTITNAGNLAVNLTPDGQQYLVGPEGGSAATTDSTRYKDLSFVVEQVGGGVLATVNATALGGAEAIANLALPSAGSYLVRVLGTGSETQLYNLRLTLSGITASTGGTTDTFRLLSIAPNATEIFSNTRANVLVESPRELVFRFDADLDRNSLRQGIRIRPAGADKEFTAADTPITPAFLDFGESNRIVIARFSEPLADDLYQVEVFGVDIPSEGVLAIRNQAGTQMKPRIEGTDRDTLVFDLELGTRIIAAVPQPVDRLVNGTLQQRRKDIEIYFNDGELYNQAVTTGTGTNPAVVDPQFYALISTKDTVSPNDDEVVRPQTISYDPALRRATLTFAQDIDQVFSGGTFRLKIGSSEAIASSTAPISPTRRTPGTDPLGVIAGSFDIGTINGSFSTIVSEELRVNNNPLLNDYPGSKFEPGRRDVQEESPFWQPVGSTPQIDQNQQISKIFYSLKENESYGVGADQRPLFSVATADQKQRIREVYEFYSAQLGIDFVELAPGSTRPGGGAIIHDVVVGDMSPNLYISGPGNELGIANPNPLVRLAILDGSESWDNSFGSGSNIPGTQSFFKSAMREIGRLLGLGDTFDLPPGTIMGDYVEAVTRQSTNARDQLFPGTQDVVHGQHLFRPDNRDSDLYRFVVSAGTKGEFRAETIAQRLNNSSSVDTYLSLMRRELDGSLTLISANGNYFGKDSLLRVELEAGEYYLSVTSKGNEDTNPLVDNSGSGGVSQGRYDLRVDFKSTAIPRLVEERTGSTAKGSALDGDGDGLAGGDFNFWFRALQPIAAGELNLATRGARAIYVDKLSSPANPALRDGSLAAPFLRIQEATAASRPGDVIRLIGDKQNTNLSAASAYEIGDAGSPVGVLSDGATLDVPRGVTLMIDSGAILKFAGSKILVGSDDSTTDRSNAAIQVLGIPGSPVYFTSHFDQTTGLDSNPLNTTPIQGQWGGIEIRNDFDRAQGRVDREREGIFLNAIFQADMRFGGGLTGTGQQARAVNPIYMAEARPLIVGNNITRSSDAAISLDPDSFEETLFTESRYQNVGDFVPDYSRVGPSIYSNSFRNNSINGLFVRIDTVPGVGLKPLNVPARIDDTEAVIVFGENLILQGSPGGAIRETAPPLVTTVILNQVAPTQGSGFAAATAAEYLVTYVDRFGQESLPSASVTINVAVNQAVRLSNLPLATFDYVGKKLYRRNNGAGPFRLVANLSKDATSFTDNGGSISGSLQTQGLSEIERARRSASLIVDPGIVLKSFGGRIELGISSTMLAEGSKTKPIIFTSRLDDRFGAAGSFDTNNDGAGTSPAAGDWSGIVARHLGDLSIDNSLITFGGGTSRVPGGFASFNAIEIHQSDARIANSILENNASGRGTPGTSNRAARGVNDPAVIFVLGSQPIIMNNVIRNNSVAGTAAISIDANSLNYQSQRDPGRSTGLNLRENVGIGNYGPLVRNNRLGNNGLNGMNVRGGILTTEGVWDDTDIVHILQSEISIPDFATYGGLRLTSKSDESLVIKLQGGSTAGFTATGRPLEIKDRIGGSLNIVGSPGFPVVLTSIQDDSIGAGFDFLGRAMLDTSNNNQVAPTPGDWRSVLITPFSNDRNVSYLVERESDELSSTGDNDFPSQAQDLGVIAPNMSSGDENRRLGTTVTGVIASPSDVDVYKFVGTAGTTVWFDIDQTSGGLDTVIDIIDANGNILAQSNQSIGESLAQSVYVGPGSGTKARPMDQVASAKRNELVNTQVDFLGVNPLDAGLRVILPGEAGSQNTFYARVRSSNLKPGDAAANLQNPLLITSGQSTGVYKLQARLQQKQEIPGTSIQFADIRYATTGIDIQGHPLRSPLVGEVGEIEAGNTSANAQTVGNIFRTDMGATSVAGSLNARADIDWYNFSVRRESIAPFSVDHNRSPHQSVTFDIDYAAGFGRANTQLWIFSRSGTNLTLVATGDSSNILDDQPSTVSITDNSDLSRGSRSNKDAFVGPFELLPGDYVVAVSNASLSHIMTQQFTSATPNSALVRFEPLDSVRRIAEDRFDSNNPSDSTNLTPVQTAFAGIPGSGVTSNAVPFNLSDVTLFASTGQNIHFINPLTGAQEAIYSTNGTSAFNFGSAIAINDIAVAPNGQAVGFQNNTGAPRTDANSGTFIGIDIGNGAAATSTSGLNTFISRIVTPVATPPTYETIQVPNAGGNNGVGMIFDGLTFSPQFATDIGGGSLSPSFWGVASRGSAAAFQQPQIGGQNNDQAVGLAGNGITKNILYRLNSLTDGSVGQARNPAGSSRAGAQQGLGAGTNIIERGYFVRQAGTGGGLAPITGWTDANGTVRGLAAAGTRYYAVTDQGELMGLTIPSDGAAQLWSDQYVVILDPATNTPIPFRGLTFGPRNVEGGRYANLLFGSDSNNRLWAFDTNGVLQPIFPRGEFFVSLGSNGIQGIGFSSLDVNLWHVSREEGGTAGHGRLVSPNNSRTTTSDAHLKFGYSNPTAGTNSQQGNWSGLYNVPTFYGNTALPGGAMGALESNLIDLREYSPEDRPMLYFNYNLTSQNSNSAIGDNTAMLDSFRVYGAAEDGNWILLSTNNSARSAGRYSDVQLSSGSDEFDVANNGYQNDSQSGNPNAPRQSYLAQELYDNAGWRQARVDLGPFAGKRDIRIRFEFATGGDFRTGAATLGGQELVAIPGERLLDGQTFTIEVGGAPTVFEFDLGLVLNLPSGSALQNGDRIRINATDFTFRLNPLTPAPTDIPFTATSTPSQIAASVRTVLQAAGNVIVTSLSTPNVLNVTGLAAGGTYEILGANPNIIIGRPGVTAGNRSVSVTNAMTAVQVRDAIRTSLAQALNVVGQQNNVDVYKTRGNAVVLHNMTIANRGPLAATTGRRPGDFFGALDTGGPAFTQSFRAQNNNNTLLRIDDIIVGFAERGEMILNATASEQFVDTFEYERYGATNGGVIDEIETGAYQLEIRSSADYGTTSSSSPTLSLPTIPLIPLQLGRTFDTNDRLSKSYRLRLDTSSGIADGSTFTLGDGINVATFEFDVLLAGETRGQGVAQGNIPIVVSPNATSGQIVRAIRDKINDPITQGIIKITASTGGEWRDGSGTNLLDNRSNILYLNGNVASDLFGGLNFNSGGVPFTFVEFGQDATAIGTDFGEDMGDQNAERIQGQMIVSSTSVSRSRIFGINLDAAAQAQGVAGVRPYPGAARNLVTLNASNVAAGAVLVNNLLWENGSDTTAAERGAIRVSGDLSTTNGTPPQTIARLVNNTLVGRGDGAGILINEGATPSILNNIISGFTTGIQQVAPASSVQPELGANIYQRNTNNVVPATLTESGAISLALSDPLFVNPSTGRFYLQSLSRAIDSSIDSLEDRSVIEQVKEAIDIPTSPILAPGFDINGLRRIDDPNVNSSGGQGGNVFIDRGAYERADFIGPSAVLLRPLDNDANSVDSDRSATYLMLKSGDYDFFEILLDERAGTGVDPDSLTPSSLIVTQNGRLLIEGADYIFGYSVNSRTIRLTPLAGFWRRDSVYEISLVNTSSFRLDAPAAADIPVGQEILFDIGMTTVRMQFDFGGGVPAGVIPIPVASNFTPTMVSGQILKALTKASLGISVNGIGNRNILISGISNLRFSGTGVPGLSATSIAPIVDLAGNRLQANRANSQTQFTIAMPEVGIDYGDAIERLGTGSISRTPLSDNGVRHAMYPIDEPLLVLGRFADTDPDGVSTPAADSDDFDSSVLFSTGLPVSLAPNGPARLTVSAPTAAMLGKRIVITDSVNKTVTYQFTDGTQPPVPSGIVGVDLTGVTTANGAAARLQAAILGSILAGDITGIHSIANGNTVSLGGTTGHRFDLSQSGGFVQRVAAGRIGLAIPADVSSLAQGQTLTIQDGSGNQVIFQIIDSTAPIAVVPGNTPLSINISTATQASFGSALLQAINSAISSGKLRLPPSTLANNILSIFANDEDGVTFAGLFNSRTPPVQVSVTASNAGLLDAWIDWNQDNDFDDAGEQLLASEPVAAGANSFSVVTPTAALSGYTTARFRLSATGGLFTTGLAIGGEVEDYAIEILPGAPPVAVDDPSSSKAAKYRVNEDSVLTVIAADGVLSNDLDIDSPTFTVFDTDPNTAGVQPTVGTQNGTLVLQLDGSFVYTPNADFFGTDTFVYQVTDPRMVGNRPATVTLTVSPINDTPLANPDAITINEDTPQVWSGALFTSNDFGGATAGGQAIPNEASQNLRVVGVQLVNASGNPITPRVGESLTLSNNVINYTPGSNYNSLIGGNVFIRMVVEDDGVSYSSSSNSNIADPKQSISTLTVTIDPVNDRPTFTIPNSTINLSEDPGSQTLVNFVTNVLAGPIADTPNGIGPADDELGNVAGIPGQNVTFAVRAINPARFTTAGQPALVRNGTNGTLTFTLAPDVNSVNSGPILVEIIAQDGTPPVPSIPQTITINVAQVNDPPVFDTSFTTITIDEDAPLQVFPRFYFNLAPGPATAVDEAGQTLTTTVVAATPQYFLTQPRISAAGDFEFQLAPDVNSLFSGSLNVLITLTDSGTPNASLTRTITIVANDINDAPLLSLNTTNINVREDETTLTGVTPTSVKGLVASLSQGPLTALDELGNFAPTVPGQVMSFSLISVSNPTLFSQAPAIDGTGTLTFVTAPNRNGSAAVVMRLTDNGRASPAPNSNVGPTVTFTISVAAINDAPEFSMPSSLDVVEDQGVVSVPGFATGIRPGPETAFDESRQTLTFNLVQFDPNLFEIAPSLQSDGTLSFKTRLDINSNTPGISRVVAFQLQDGGVSEPPPNTNLSVIRSFTLNVTPVNDPPIPGAFIQPGTEDLPLTILAANVEQVGRPGPIDEEVVERQQIRMTQIERTSERGGLVVPVFNGDRIVSIQYTPPSNFVGDDTIRYVLTDSGSPERSATGSIVVRVTGVNDAPQFTPGPDLNVLEDSAPYNASWATNILAGPINAPDEWSGPDAQTVSFQVTANNPAFFSVQPAIDAAGVLSFTLAKDVNGVVTVDVTAIDNGASQPPNVNTSTTHRLSIVIGAVNDPPGFVLGGNISRDEDSGPFVSATPFVTKIVGAEGMNNTPPTGTDEAGQSVTLLTTNSNNALFSVQPAIDSTGRLTFTSAPDASGFVEVYVVGVDNGPSTPPNVNRSQRQVFTIELKPLNDAPFAVNDSYATSEDDLLSIAAPGVLANDRDVDLPNDTLQVVTPTSGSLTSTLGAIVVLNADGSFTYAPRGSAQLQRLTIGETVVDTFTYTIRDLAGALSNLGTVSITVTGINDNPVAVNDSFRVAAGLPTLLDVLANDTDIDSSIDVRTVEIGRIPSNGRVVVLPTGRVEYTPTAGFVGQDSFTYRFRDSLGAPSNEATVIVNSSNPPVAVDDTFTVVRNTPTVIDVLRNDFDPDQGGALDRTTLTIASGPDVGTAVILADGTIRYTPSTGFSGTATFQYFVSDTTGQPSNLARVTLNVVNSLHQNPVNKMDVNDDGFVSPIDVLFIVNDINFNGFRPLPDSFGRPPFLDVNGNGGTDALDVLEIINFINSVGSGGAGEGEASGAAALMSTQVDVEIMSQQAFVELRQREEKLTQDILHELTLAAVLEREMEFGPALPLSSRIDEEDSLADYLARLRTGGTLDDESTDLDGIFSGDAWL